VISGYIPNDGYERGGYIAEVPGLHMAIRFRFRPLTAPAVADASDKIRRATTPGKGEELAAALVAKRVVSWNFSDDEGKELKITAETCSRQVAALKNRMLQIVLGYDPGDADPEGPKPEDSKSAEEEMDAVLAGHGSVAEADTKN
jgi:hypothetical protein